MRFVPAQFRSTTPEDLPAIRGLLQTAFGIGPGAPSIDAKLLSWKYRIARGYVLEQESTLLAHGALWPGTVTTRAGPVAFANLLDWASVKSPPGMGVVLLRRLSEVSPVLVSTGGSAHTRSIMPRIGFRHAGNQSVWARVVRPFRQHRTRPKEGFLRSMTRLARNVMWSFAPHVPLVGQAASRAQFEGEPCPTAAVSAWSLRNGGHFVLYRVGGQCRIARLRIESNRAEDWAAAYAVASQTAQQDPGTCEVIALSSSLMVSQALATNSFRIRDHRPTFVYDPKRIIPPDAGPLEFDMLDDDMAYMNIPEHPYLT